MVETRSLKTAAPAGGSETLLEVVHRLFPQECAATTRFRARSYVFHQGTPVTAVHLALNGTLVLERIDECGRVAMFGTHQVGGLLDWQDLLGGRIHRSSCQSVGPSELITIPAERFQTALHENEELLLELMRLAAEQATTYEDHIFHLSTLDVPQRLYHTLLTLAESSDADDAMIEVKTPLMKRDIAALIGTTPETLSRGLRRLSKLKVVEFTKNKTFRIFPGRSDDLFE